MQDSEDACQASQGAGRRVRLAGARPFRTGLICGIALLVGLRLLINETSLADRLVAPLAIADGTGPADLIVVAGAGVVGVCEPNVNALRRTMLAVASWKERRAPAILFTGGRAADASCAISRVMADFARTLGVPDGSLLLETTSRSTRQNAEHSLPILRGLGVRRLILVTDRLHLRRASAAFEHFGFEVIGTSVPVYGGHPDNVSMVLAAAREVVALLYYGARGWTSPPSAGMTGAGTAAGYNGAGMQTTAGNPRVVVLGASYAGGWDLPGAGRMTIVNKGASGQQSFELLERFDADVVAEQPQFVVLWGFINDIFRSDRAAMDKTLARAKASFLEMIRRARAHGIEPVLATEVTIRPSSSWSETVAGWAGGLLGKKSYQDVINGHVLEMNAWIRETAAREKLLLLDLQPVVSDSSQRRVRRFANPDGSHISAEGYAALTAYALPLLIEKVSSAGSL
jgi:uncharacterized SAM-binding protein YcdF (DUF218 family)/lysophospholipase L1-like esterase